VSRSVALVVLVAAVVGVAVFVFARGGEEGPSPPSPEELLREGTRLTIGRTADLDGDGTAEVVVAARAVEVAQFQHPAQYLDVYAYRDGDWARLFSGTEQAPPGDGGPATMLDRPGDELVGRLPNTVEVVDFAGDGAPEMVVGILTVGAGPGPLELWVLSMTDSVLRTELYERTERDGELRVRGGRLLFEFDVYRPADPGCCPSRVERQVIGYAPGEGQVAVLERRRSEA
jgi:hypothetical protein